MADLGIWWKLWISALDDPDLDNLDIADFGRWAKFGAFVKAQGTDGGIVLSAPSRQLCAMFQLPDFDAVIATLQRFPHADMRRDKSNVSGETTVKFQFHNWPKYQGDLSTPRVRRFREMKRSKRRREEKREDENKKRSTPSLSPPTIVFQIPASVTHALQRCPHFGTVPSLLLPAFWQAQVRSFPAVDLAAQLLRAEAWITANPVRAPRRSIARFLHNWFVRAAEQERE